MDRQTIALMVQEGSKFITQIIRTRPLKRVESVPPATVEELAQEITETTPEAGKASSIQTGCVPCAIGHFGTCTGLLNESMRFARNKGLDSNEVIDRVTHCLQELNALEREDLTSENIISLPEWEKELALEALNASRSTRHMLEGATSIDELEKAVASTQTTNTRINRKWFKERLARMPKGEKTKLVAKAVDKLEEE